MYELWSVVMDSTGIYPFFLKEKGEFKDLYIKFMEMKNTIITDNKGKIIKSHLKL